jgi:PPOX class probable F420-dependent enzyme
MTSDEARRRFASSPVARLATVDGSGRPHLVPMVFALDDRDVAHAEGGPGTTGRTTVVGAVDHKPKRSPSLRRVANIAANPHVCLLVDHYDEDWDRLWWARADGSARVVGIDHPEGSRAVELLAERYAPYRSRPPQGPVVLVDVHRWSGWQASVPHL